MANGSRVCPSCRRLNSVDDATCAFCGQRMPGPLAKSYSDWFGQLSPEAAPITKLLVLINCLVYSACVLTDAGAGLRLALTGSFRLSTLLRFGLLYRDLGWSEPWRLLAAVFMHLGLLHIGMNMLALVNLGRPLEARLGSARFLIVYVLTGILGFGASQWWYGSSPPTAGASGAIFGLIGALVGVLLARRDPRGKRAFVNYLAYSVILSFVLPVNTAAHVGGFFAGIALGALLEREKNPERREAAMRTAAGLCLLASLGSVALSALSPVWRDQRLIEERAVERAERQRLDSE